MVRSLQSCCLLFWLSLLWGISPSTLAEALDIEILGLEGKLKRNVEAHLGIVGTAKDKKKQLVDAEIRRLHHSAPHEIERALQAFGYYEPRIESSLKKIENRWRARYKIHKGPPTRLRNVTIGVVGEGEKEPEIQQLLASVDIARGQKLRHDKYSKLKSELPNTAYAMGYLDGKYLRSRIEVHPEKQLADIELVFDTGPRYFFGAITIQQDILSPQFVSKFVELKPDDPFETQRLIDLQLALSDSDYFRQVELKTEKDKAQGQHVPVSVLTQPTKSQKYEASAGFGTDTGPRVGLGTLFRRINRSGHQFRTDLRWSAIQSTLVSQYKIPVGDVASEYLDFTANADQKDVNDVDATNYAVGGGLNQHRWGGWRRLSLALEHESWAFGDDPRRSSNLLIPAINYTRKIADNPLFTRKGYSFSLRLHGAAENVLADTTFLQAQFNARAVLPLGQRGRFLLRGEYGATTTDSFDDLPPSQRFFAGGAQSVRGYGFEELSPRDAARNLIGGQYLASASLELDYLLFGNFGVAIFADAGNASDKPDMNLQKGAGLGLRYRSPVGMIRVDFAHPFDDPDRSFRFHISIGPDLQ